MKLAVPRTKNSNSWFGRQTWSVGTGGVNSDSSGLFSNGQTICSGSHITDVSFANRLSFQKSKSVNVPEKKGKFSGGINGLKNGVLWILGV
jgi:hypothetical protein